MTGLRSAPAGRFELVDHCGRRVSERTFLGTYVLILFGFTRCRVVCPRALTKLSRALDRIGPAADRVTPLYVTIDPARDDADTMRAFLASWPRFLGLVGNEGQIEAVRSSFRVFARRTDEPGDDYQLSHSAFTHLLDPGGAHVDHWGDHLSEDEVVERLKRHVAAQGCPTQTGPTAGTAAARSAPLSVRQEFG